MRDFISVRREPKSRFFIAAVIFSALSLSSVLVAFSTPYWLESYHTAPSDFVRLGLWTACFRNYRHPPYHTEQVYDGCHWLFGIKYKDIRGWLQPGWFVCVQVLISTALVLSSIAMLLLILLMFNLMRSFKVFVLAVIFVLASLSALVLFLSISVFGGMCYDRAWIQYPNYNHISWSYGMAVIAFLFEVTSSIVLLAEAFYARRHIFFARDAEYSLSSRN